VTAVPRDLLHLFVVYRSPRDYPAEYVVREQVALPTGRVAIAPHLAARASTLEGVRREIRQLPRGRGLVCVPRQEDDDSAIVEVWL